MKKYCGYCKHHDLVQLSCGIEWCCCNPESEYVGYETEFNSFCEEFEAREGEDDE